MTSVGFPDNPSHVLQLVSTALDEFESVGLGPSLRRALRIARLRGDSADAFRFALELGLSDEGSVESDIESAGAARVLHGQLAGEKLHPNWREAVLEAFRDNRTVKIDPKLLGHDDAAVVSYLNPIEQLGKRDAPYEDQLSLASQIERQNRRHVIDQMHSNVRNLAFRYLIDCETELRISVTGDRLFGRHRLRVDTVLRQSAPDVLDKLSAAVRRANESKDDEVRAQALLSCRRVLEAVADLVFPAQDEPHIDKNGKKRSVGPGNYRNRIVAALETSDSPTYAGAVKGAIEEFATRLDALDALTQKGVHAKVTQAQMEFAVVQTYLLAGEVLSATSGDPRSE